MQAGWFQIAGSQSKMGFWEPMMHNIEGNSVWIKLVQKKFNLALAPGFARERLICFKIDER